MGGTFKWEIHKNVKKNKIGRLCWEICEKKKNCPTVLHSPLYWFFFKYVELFGEAKVKNLLKNLNRKIDLILIFV
jgi:hypothetical protein